MFWLSPRVTTLTIHRRNIRLSYKSVLDASFPLTFYMRDFSIKQQNGNHFLHHGAREKKGGEREREREIWVERRVPVRVLLFLKELADECTERKCL